MPQSKGNSLKSNHYTVTEVDGVTGEIIISSLPHDHLPEVFLEMACYQDFRRGEMIVGSKKMIVEPLQ